MVLGLDQMSMEGARIGKLQYISRCSYFCRSQDLKFGEED
jgi:hypothetical protein